MTRLNQSLLEKLPAEVARPAYDRFASKAGIVHLGAGAFHRAHQAWYTDQVMNRNGGDWGIVGASLRSGAVADQLNPQDGLYTVVERDGDKRHYQVIGAIREIVVAPDNPEKLINQLAHADVRVITLTITEKGYCYSAGADGLMRDNSAIEEDITGYPDNPRTALGYLAVALRRRRDRRAGGVTLLSCDNLPHNGRVLHRVLVDFVSEVDPSLLLWIGENVSFPCSMVDRIVPATTEADLAHLEQALGYADRGAIFTEPFSQWVIEDNFICGAPDWASVGALYTDDVTPFETMKLRLLNGSHSLMAYLGYLAGYDYVHQVMANPAFSALVRLFMDTEAQPTLKVPAGFDIENYKSALCCRFDNPALKHRLYQIAQDGSQKIPQRWLAPLRDSLEAGRPVPVLTLALAGWLRYLGGVRENGETFAVDDPRHAMLARALSQVDHPVELLDIRELFGDLSRQHPRFVDAVADCHDRMEAQGVMALIAEVAAAGSSG